MKDKHMPGPIRPIIHEAIGGGDYIQLLVGSWDIAHNRYSARKLAVVIVKAKGETS